MDYIRSAVKCIFRKKLRCFLTVIGISIGVMSVIIIGNISQCGSNAINKEIEELGMDGVMVSAEAYYTDGVPLGENELEVIKSLSYVENAVPLTVETVSVNACGNEYSSMLWGITSDTNSVISMNLLYGRLINNYDISVADNVCIVDCLFAQKVYGRDNIVGKYIYISCGGIQEQYKVIGVIKTGGNIMGSIMGNVVPEFIYIPYTTMEKYRYSSDFQKIAVQLKSEYNAESICTFIENELNDYNNVSSGYTAVNMVQQKDSINNILNIITIVLSCVGAVSLLVASLNIMTVMTVSVSERKREIGIKKAIGAKKINIIYEFLIEAILISLIGCIIGVIIGMVVSYIGMYIFNISIAYRWDIIIFTSLFSLVSGIIFGVYPAIKASNLNPVDALRVE